MSDIDNIAAPRPTSCEYCGAPVDRSGDYCERHSSRDAEATTRIASLAMMDPVGTLTALMRAVEHATLPDIAATLSKALGRRVAVPALHKRIKRTAASYPMLAAVLTPRLAATKHIDAKPLTLEQELAFYAAKNGAWKK